MSVEIARSSSAAIDSRRWPAVAQVPSGPASAVAAVIADRLLRRAAARLPLRLVYPHGAVVGGGDAASPALVINRPGALSRRLGRYGLIGFGESYMAGEWEADDLTAVLTVLAASMGSLVPRTLQRLRPIAAARQPRTRLTSRAQARRDIAQHYDLSDALFIDFLDETMTYSSGLFRRLPASWPDLADAQRHKVDRVLDAAGVRAGSRVLEIGSGWGELCIRAARRGAHIHSVTLSADQRRLARQRVAAAGLSDRVRIDLCDYRDVHGCYDAVVSVEMIEAVGYRAWPDYFRTLDRLLAANGRAAIQAITMPHARMLATRDTHTWIQKYIFPGGFLPSVEAIAEITKCHTNLRTVDMFSLRPHYAETLRLWRERFMQRRITLSHIGFDKVFARMWEFYLAYAEAGFRSGYLDVHQWTFAAKHAR